MNNRVIKQGLTLGLAALLAASAATPTGKSQPSGLGIDTKQFDTTVRPQDDYYRYINGQWLDTAQIPSDRSTWGSFAKLNEDSNNALRAIIEQTAKSADKSTDADELKIAALYKSFMDEGRLELLGATPLNADLARIESLKDKSELPGMLAYLSSIGVTTPFSLDVDQDARNSSQYIVSFSQSGLGLPDRDYYLKADDARLKNILDKYQAHIADMFSLMGDKGASRKAAAIVALETRLARGQWPREDTRDPEKNYNKYAIADLGKLVPGFEWKRYLVAAEVAGKGDAVVVGQPSYMKAFATQFKTTSLPIWKAYLKWHLLSDYAPYLSKAYVDSDFAFYKTTVRGVPENEARWKRGVGVVESSIGEGLGKLYVAKYFPAESKARMQTLVDNLVTAYRQSITSLDWMSPATKDKALQKLAKFSTKIGYPEKWRDYTALTVAPDDLVGNMMRAQRFEYRRNVAKLGKPIDRNEWEMTPQTVNAYYKPEKNEIVFPAAILQPPFFDPTVDDAANYGGIGAVIGHEISHGFDDEGSKYDGDGNLNNWWTADDHKRFATKTAVLVAQYAAYEPLPGYHVNGKLTLGENIADNSGMAIAYKAYHLSLQNKPGPTIEGMTGDQRFFAGWAQVWRGKVRDAEIVRRIKADPHSPPAVRGAAPLRNQPGFYDAYDLKAGDKMYLPPDQRVTIW